MADHGDLIGKPFAYGGRGPEEFDCFGVIKELLRRDGIAVPDYDTADAQATIEALFSREQRLYWRPCEAEEGSWYIDLERNGSLARHHYTKGAVVLFRILGLGSHVGYVTGPNTFVHTWEGARLGVLTERIDDWEHRIIGFYRYVG